MTPEERRQERVDISQVLRELHAAVASVRKLARFLVALYVFMFLAVAGVVAWLEHEGDVRADGQCHIFEGDQRDEVEQLANTYEYLRQAQRLPPEKVDEQLIQFALAQLPQTIAKAEEDQAPGYCDEPDVGEPEPDPVLPAKPADLKLPDLPPG
jgi:hypothetical protein